MRFREARREDVPFIIQLIANDPLGQWREKYEDPLPKAYYEALDTIRADAHQEVMVVEDEPNNIIGTFQLSFIPYLTYQGGFVPKSRRYVSGKI